MIAASLVACGHEVSDGEPTAIATDINERICGACAHAASLEQMAREDRWGGYLSMDGKAITTWDGRPLGTVTRSVVRRVGFRGYASRRPERVYFTIRDAHGAMWHGQSQGNGMVASLRRGKGAQ
jgi:hypothetical protein